MNYQNTTKQPSQTDRLHGLTGTFFPAKIMFPSEVKNATNGRPSAEKKWTDGKAYLCGDVHTSLFVLLKAEVRDEVAVRLTAFNSPAGGSYAVVSHQILGFVHRFVLPLYEPVVGGFLLGLQQNELGFSFGNDGSRDAVLLHSPLDGAAFAPLLAMSNVLARPILHNVMTELPMVISALNQPGQVPSLRRGEVVKDVSVSVVLPGEAMVRYFSDKGWATT
jgi:hypothetical protein